jgi:hypothetical protein
MRKNGGKAVPKALAFGMEGRAVPTAIAGGMEEATNMGRKAATKLHGNQTLHPRVFCD